MVCYNFYVLRSTYYVLTLMRQRDWAGKHYRNPYFRAYTEPHNWRRDIDMFLLVLTCFAWTYFIFFSSFFSIKYLIIDNSEYIPQSAVRSAIEAQMQSTRWYLFPEDNVFLFNQKSLDNILRRMYILDELTIQKLYPDTLQVTLKEKVSSVLWTNRDKTFFVDLQGIAFKEISSQELTNFLKTKQYPVVQDAVHDAVEQGDKVIEPDALGDLIYASQRLPEDPGIGIRTLTYTSNLPQEVEITVDEGWKLKASLGHSAMEPQLKKLSTLFHEKLKERNTIAYIDVRYGDKIFYKEKGVGGGDAVPK